MDKESYEKEVEESKHVSKVRGGFISRENLVKRSKIVPVYKYYIPDQTRNFNPSFMVCEREGTINTELGFLGQFYKITSCWLDETFGRPHFYCSPILNASIEEIPWEMNVNRLLTLGDSDAKEWADLISNFNKELYIEKKKVTNSHLYKAILKMTNLKGEQIELKKKYPYLEMLYEINTSQPKLIQLSFSESFLEPFGFTREIFPSWVLKNGIPFLAEKNVFEHVEFMKKLYGIFTGKSEPVESHEIDYSVWIDDKKGKKRLYKTKINLFGDITMDDVIRFEINVFIVEGPIYTLDTDPNPEYFEEFEKNLKKNEMEEFMKKFYQYLCTNKV